MLTVVMTMTDMENVIKWLEEISDYFFDIYRNDTDSYKCEMALQRSDAAIDAIAMLKEQKGLMLSLEQSNAANGYLNAEVERLNGLLKEREAVKPVLDERTGRVWLCGKCGSYVGFEDNDPHDPNEFDKFCRECGRPVLWEGR